MTYQTTAAMTAITPATSTIRDVGRLTGFSIFAGAGLMDEATAGAGATVAVG
jgi:hypothetical protein